MRLPPEDTRLIRHLLWQKGFTQRDIATALHVSEATVSYWQQRKRRPSQQHLIALRALVETVKTPGERQSDARIARMAAIMQSAMRPRD